MHKYIYIYYSYIYTIYIYIYIYIYVYPHAHVSSFRGLISVAQVNKHRTTGVTRVLKAPCAELCQDACGVVNQQKIFCSYQKKYCILFFTSTGGDAIVFVVLFWLFRVVKLFLCTFRS